MQLKQLYKSLILVVCISLTANAGHAAVGFHSQYEQFESEYLQYLENALIGGFEMQYKINGVEVAPGCSSFMSSEQRLGAQGQYVVNEIQRNAGEYPSLINGRALEAACPNYSQLALDKKAVVITLLLTTMAHFESSCRVNVRAQGPNGVASGLFQLHLGREAAYDGNDDACVRNASLNANQSIRCTLGMLNLQISRSGLLFDPRSYWDVLHPRGEAQSTGLISRAMSRSTLCQQ